MSTVSDHGLASARLEQLYRVTATLARAQRRADIGRIFSREITEILGADTAWVGVLNSERTVIHALGSYGYPEHVLSYWERLDLKSGAAIAHVVRTGLPQFWETRDEWIAAYPDRKAVITASGQESAAMLPLIDDGEISGENGSASGSVIGGIVVGFRSPRSFNAATRGFFRALSQQCSLALLRSRTYEAEQAARAEAEIAQKRAEQLQLLTAMFARAVDSRAVVEAAVLAGRIIGSTTGALALLVENGSMFTLIAGPGMSDEIAREWQRFPNAGPSPAVEAVRTRQPCYSTTRAEFVRHPVLVRVAEQLNINANAALPLIVGGEGDESRVLGIIAFTFDNPRQFSPDDDRFLRSVADQCALALERLRLFEAEQQARADAERARASAETANASKSQFLATMSHELRTPLHAIGGYAELLEIGVHGAVSDEQRDVITRIRRSHSHLLSLINEVLNYARLEAGAVQYHLETVKLVGAIASAESFVLPQVRAEGLELEIAAVLPSLAVIADAEKLNQILLNLLSNAVKFTKRGGRITIECAAAGDSVAITVCDTGSGIAQEQLERIFDPFVQVGRTLTSPHEGTGLGLAISRDLARAMGGEVTVRSELGRGSCFVLTLPAA